MKDGEEGYVASLLVRSISIARAHDFDRMIDRIRIAIRCVPLSEVGYRSSVGYEKFIVCFDVEPEDECLAADALVSLLQSINQKYNKGEEQ
jgi:hypothetical protein